MENLIQLWIPLFDKGPYNRDFLLDIDRAKMEWNGEDRIWIHPDISTPKRWTINDGSLNYTELVELAVPGSHLNVISIIHIDEKRNFFPKHWVIPEEWERIPENLYKQWVESDVGFLKPPEEPIRITVPDLSENMTEVVRYKTQGLIIQPGPSFPIEKLDKEGIASVNFAPKGKGRPLCAEFEGNRVAWDRENNDGISTIDTVTGAKGANYFLLWKNIFDRLFFLGGSADVLLQKWEMRRCIELRDINSCNIWLNKFQDTGESTPEKAWLYPRLSCDKTEAVLTDIEGKYESQYGLDCHSLTELESSPQYEDVFRRKIPITRIMGWMGYFWWELHNVFQHTYPGFCKRCGKLIKGRSDKVLCSKEENIECFQKGATERQRKKRGTIVK